METVRSPRLPPPSSNRTCGFPASGFHVNSRRRVVHEAETSLNSTAQPGSQERTGPQPSGWLLRRGTFVQAEFPPSYSGLLTFRPLGSTVISRFPATMSLSDSPSSLGERLLIPAPNCWPV